MSLLLDRLEGLAKIHDRAWMDTRRLLHDETRCALEDAAKALRKIPRAKPTWKPDPLARKPWKDRPYD